MKSEVASWMLPWIPMSPPDCCFRSATYSAAEVPTWTEFAQVFGNGVELNTCFWVALMKLAKGSTSDVGQ